MLCETIAYHWQACSSGRREHFYGTVSITNATWRRCGLGFWCRLQNVWITYLFTYLSLWVIIAEELTFSNTCTPARSVLAGSLCSYGNSEYPLTWIFWKWNVHSYSTGFYPPNSRAHPSKCQTLPCLTAILWKYHRRSFGKTVTIHHVQSH